MKNFTAITLLASVLVSCSSKKSASFDPKIIGIQRVSYTGSDAGFAASSHLLMGEKDAILVDAQFTRSDAEELLKVIRAEGKDLKFIFITHGHPDHYFGLQWILKAYPQAKVVARPRVVQEIRRTHKKKLKEWTATYAGEMPTEIFVPQILKSRLILLEGQRIDIMEFRNTESHYSSALYIPSLQTLVSGDLIYSGVHLWLADERGSISKWKKALDRLSSVGPIEIVLPGHGEEASAEVIGENIRYLQDFEEVKKRGSVAEALKAIKDLYPKYRLPIIADLSLQKHLLRKPN